MLKYLDYNAITCGFSDIITDVTSLINGKFLNPSSVHSSGKEAKKILETAKKEIATTINAKCHDIYFTSGATEANNMVLNCQPFSKILTIPTEHPSILDPLKYYNHEFIKIDKNGLIDIEDLKQKASNSSNFLCSIAYANNESGVIQQNINSIIDIVKNAGGLFHSDVSQVVGKFKLDLGLIYPDFITFSGNKIHSGFGGGVLVCTSGTNINPLILGGGQQNYKRAGTENISQIYSIQKALAIVNSQDYLQKYANQALEFKQMIEGTVLLNNGEVFAHEVPRLYNTSLIKMPKINNFIQLMEFDLNGFCISIGSACSSGKTESSHVLRACGVPEEDGKHYIRVSTGIFTTQSEVEEFCSLWQNLSKRI